MQHIALKNPRQPGLKKFNENFKQNKKLMDFFLENFEFLEGPEYFFLLFEKFY